MEDSMRTKVKMSVIESYIGENFLSYTEFCKLCGICMPIFNKIKNGVGFRLNALVKIAQAIDVSLSDLIEDAF